MLAQPNEHFTRVWK